MRSKPAGRAPRQAPHVTSPLSAIAGISSSPAFAARRFSFAARAPIAATSLRRSGERDSKPRRRPRSACFAFAAAADSDVQPFRPAFTSADLLPAAEANRDRSSALALNVGTFPDSSRSQCHVLPRAIECIAPIPTPKRAAMSARDSLRASAARISGISEILRTAYPDFPRGAPISVSVWVPCRAPRGPRPFAFMSSMLSWLVPKNRCDGLTQAGDRTVKHPQTIANGAHKQLV